MKALWSRIHGLRYQILIVLTWVCYIALVYAWQRFVLPEEKGLFSPFQSGISLIRYLGIIMILNSGISIASFKRQPIWIIAPILANAFLLLYSAYYIWVILRID